MANVSNFDLIVDLYCGIGSIGLSSSSSCPIVGVEIVEDAVKDARENAKENGIDNAEFYVGDAKDAFRIISEKKSENPLVILDPPRKGLSEELIRDICESKIRNVLYISCGADTFARDLKKFNLCGYKIGKIQPVDLFPRTSHVETVCLLSRK